MHLYLCLPQPLAGPPRLHLCCPRSYLVDLLPLHLGRRPASCNDVHEEMHTTAVDKPPLEFPQRCPPLHHVMLNVLPKCSFQVRFLKLSHTSVSIEHLMQLCTFGQLEEDLSFPTCGLAFKHCPVLNLPQAMALRIPPACKFTPSAIPADCRAFADSICHVLPVAGASLAGLICTHLHSAYRLAPCLHPQPACKPAHLRAGLSL